MFGLYSFGWKEGHVDKVKVSLVLQ